MLRRLALVAMLSALALPANAPEDRAMVLAWNRFVREANEFGQKYRDGQLDLALMKRLSRDWRDVEASGSWPQVK